MAEIKKYLDATALGTLVDQIKSEDAKVLQVSKDYSDGLATNYDVAGSAATVQGKLDEEVARAKEAEETNAAAAKKAQDEVDALELVVAEKAAQSDLGTLEQAVADLDAYVGDIPSDYTETNIVAYINKKSEETLNAASGGSSESAASVLQALNTYKAENDPKVTKNTEDIVTAQATADQAKEYAAKVATDLATEVTNRTNADTALDERITDLEGTIVGLSGAMHFEGVKDEVPTDVTGYEQGDVIIVGNKEYVLNGTAFVEFGDASVNAEAITALTGRVTTAEGKITTAEGKITTLEGSVETKAEKIYVDEAIETLEGVDTTLGNRITALEDAIGESGSVAQDIATAKQEAIDEAVSQAAAKDMALEIALKKYVDDEDARIESRVDALETASDTHALASDLTALTGRVTTAEGEIDTLQSEMDAVEAKVSANESAIAENTAAIALKASQADLDVAVANIGANTSAINSFTAITSDEVNALFA